MENFNSLGINIIQTRDISIFLYIYIYMLNSILHDIYYLNQQLHLMKMMH